MLPVLLLLGLGSVLQWYVSETRGAGDLRFYAAVQVYSALVLLVALLFPPRYTRALEFLDKPIFSAGHIASGHTLKHLAAAAAGYCILRMVKERQPVSGFYSASAHG